MAQTDGGAVVADLGVRSICRQVLLLVQERSEHWVARVTFMVRAAVGVAESTFDAQRALRSMVLYRQPVRRLRPEGALRALRAMRAASIKSFFHQEQLLLGALKKHPARRSLMPPEMREMGRCLEQSVTARLDTWAQLPEDRTKR